MLRLLKGRDHDVLTAVCLLPADGEEPDLFIDHSVVTLGPLPDADIDHYVAGDGWKGKAGGYNLSERVEAGWPIRWTGDPTSVMGLPMQRLTPMLRQRLSRDARAEAHR
jgi:septum formation protein